MIVNLSYLNFVQPDHNFGKASSYHNLANRYHILQMFSWYDWCCFCVESYNVKLDPLSFCQNFHLSAATFFVFNSSFGILISLGILGALFHHTLTAESQPYSLHLRIMLQHLFFCLLKRLSNHEYDLLQTFDFLSML